MVKLFLQLDCGKVGVLSLLEQPSQAGNLRYVGIIRLQYKAVLAEGELPKLYPAHVLAFASLKKWSASLVTEVVYHIIAMGQSAWRKLLNAQQI